MPMIRFQRRRLSKMSACLLVCEACLSNGLVVAVALVQRVRHLLLMEVV